MTPPAVPPEGTLRRGLAIRLGTLQKECRPSQLHFPARPSLFAKEKPGNPDAEMDERFPNNYEVFDRFGYPIGAHQCGQKG